MAREAAGRRLRAVLATSPSAPPCAPTDGRRYAGANVENAAYPQGQCAEASAIGALVAGGGGRIAEVVVAAPSRELCTPCGGCRQRLREFAAADAPIHLADLERVRRTTSLAELLPLSFGPGAPRGVTAGRRGDRRARARLRAAARADARLGPRRARRPARRPRRDPLRRAAGLPRRRARRPCRRARARPARRPARRDLLRPLARLRGDRRRARSRRRSGRSRRSAPRSLVLTNAAGSLRPEAGPGSLVCLSDHINLLGFNPLTGPNDDAAGPRFPSLRDAYDPELRARLHARRGRARDRAARRRLPRRRRARASRRRPRSARSARSAPTSSG